MTFYNSYSVSDVCYLHFPSDFWAFPSMSLALAYKPSYIIIVSYAVFALAQTNAAFMHWQI